MVIECGVDLNGLKSWGPLLVPSVPVLLRRLRHLQADIRVPRPRYPDHRQRLVKEGNLHQANQRVTPQVMRNPKVYLRGSLPTGMKCGTRCSLPARKNRNRTLKMPEEPGCRVIRFRLV